jgi:drug/metabolite transporter (DMT)-like permease
MVLLVAPRGGAGQPPLDQARVAAVICASISWAAGSLFARYTPKPEPPLIGVALQMLAGGAILCFTGVLAGESEAFSVTRVSTRSALAFGYLTIVGSLVGFTAYSWLLKVSTPARVSTYAYVNPVIAVFLGWALAGEALTTRMLTAAAVIVVGVIVLSTRSDH